MKLTTETVACRKLFAFPCRTYLDHLKIEDNKRTLGTYCGNTLRGKTVVVTGDYALITFYSNTWQLSGRLGFMISFEVINQSGKCKYQGSLSQ